jgi:hypothetical protein
MTFPFWMITLPELTKFNYGKRMTVWNELVKYGFHPNKHANDSYQFWLSLKESELAYTLINLIAYMQYKQNERERNYNRSIYDCVLAELRNIIRDITYSSLATTSIVRNIYHKYLPKI